MKQIWWVIIIGAGIYITYNSHLNITLSLGAWVIVLGIFGLIKSLFI